MIPNASAPGREVDKEKEYAELWMGTHPTNPAKLYDSDTLLSDYLKDNQALLGKADKFTPPYKGEQGNKGHVPFLFKILCCKQGEWARTGIEGLVAHAKQLFLYRFIRTKN